MNGIFKKSRDSSTTLKTYSVNRGVHNFVRFTNPVQPRVAMSAVQKSQTRRILEFGGKVRNRQYEKIEDSDSAQFLVPEG